VAVALGSHIFVSHSSLALRLPELILWTTALIALNAFELKSPQGPTIVVDVPLAVAACVIFQPLTAGLLGFVASLDPRELRGETSLAKALYNRSQAALGLMIASAAVAPWAYRSESLPILALACVVALTVWVLENYLTVALGTALARSTSFREGMSSLRLGKPIDFGVTLCAWGLIAVLQVAVYEVVGHWTVVAFCLMALVTRQMLARSDSVVQTEARVRLQSQTIEAMADQAAAERRDERLRIASHLHDEILQALFQVSLLGQVARHDLATGRLLELDEDLPALVLACDQASSSLRDLMRDLRNSPLGVRGLGSMLDRLGKDLRSTVSTEIVTDVQGTESLDAHLQLVIYQICKEAILNAAHHAKARRIEVSLSLDENSVRLTVQDDGVGFDPRVEKLDHFGLQIMQERAAAAGGALYIDSSPGNGTKVSAQFPSQRALGDNTEGPP